MLSETRGRITFSMDQSEDWNYRGSSTPCRDQRAISKENTEVFGRRIMDRTRRPSRRSKLRSLAYALGIFKGEIMNTSTDSEVVVSAKERSPSRIWLFIVGVLLVGTYASMFIPALAGKPINPMSGYGSMLWTGLFLYLFWKRQFRKGWVGALIGIVVGILVFVLAAFVRGLVTHA